VVCGSFVLLEICFVMRYLYRSTSSSSCRFPILHATVHLWQGHQLRIQILNSRKATSRISNWGCESPRKGWVFIGHL
jgi:hypothetical protein